MNDKWLDLNSKVVIVTGGSQGLGEKFVENLVDNGAQVIIADLVKTKNTNSSQVSFFQCDITKREQVNALIKFVLDKYGRIDALVNNAGVNRPGLLVDFYGQDKQHEMNDDDFDLTFNVNQKAVFICSQTVAKIMVKQQSGVVVTISSEAGIEGSIGQSAYAATKAAVIALTRSWAKELGRFNIRFVAIAPGINEPTPMGNEQQRKALAYTRGMDISQVNHDYQKSIPLGRPGKHEEIADLVSYLVSDHSSYITGVTINITGGKSRG